MNGDAEDRSSKRKSKNDRKYDEDNDLDRLKDKDRSRKHSHRDDKYDDAERPHRHSRSSRDDGKSRDRDRAKPVLEPDSDEVGFRIKGSKSAALNPSGMAPPPRRASDRHDRHDHHSRRSSNVESVVESPSTPADPYAEERERRRAERVEKEVQRRQTTTLGKRMSRDESEVEAPRGPKGDVKRQRGKKDTRSHNVKYEDDVDRYR